MQEEEEKNVTVKEQTIQLLKGHINAFHKKFFLEKI